ncbi:MAG: TlpA disulfide reductase family protein [Candidatus Nanopelagicales bacterium]
MSARALRIGVISFATLVVLVLGVNACSSGSNSDTLGDGQGFVSGEGDATTMDTTERTAAPVIAGQTLQGQELSLADYKGDVVVLNVWASWCGPCRAEADVLQEVAKETRADGVSFVGLNTKDNTSAALAFERNYNVSYPSLVDADGQLQLEFSESLPPDAVPSTIIVDREGRVAARILGATDYSQLKTLVKDVAAEQS